ncbi:AMP-binding protein [Ulvibacterium marinum]|uniref:AMP-binding protein n=1 Tax=Ulvibacterium marinum TaxID=2419782 RepID=UPI0024941E23|nr:AMP-binding protein [Ulvibacterium marinum]
MTKPKYSDIHFRFKFNGFHPSIDELKEIGYSLIKEGTLFEQAIGDFLLDWLDEKLVIEVKTSGSTGIPKSILLKKSQMVNSALATGDFFGLHPGDSALLCLPCDFIAGKMMLVRAMVLGLELDYVEPSSNPLEYNSNSYDFCAMVPLQLQKSLGQLKQIRIVLVGGASVSNALKKKVEHESTTIFETYGMTETITHVAVRKIHPIPPSVVETFFETLPGVTVSTDSRDCLMINAPNVCDDKVITNDLVHLISDTEFKWLGRYDNIINSGGVKLIPEQIETKLTQIISNRFFVTGFPDEKLGQKLVLLVEGEIDVETLSKKITELSSLEKYEVPKAIYNIPSFLETETGKIRRKENANLILS